ncbi:patatin-like phospholipase family protein [Ramlibacter monticola]|uniref:patatin-like phospholipase family protein n=1 Tax=Ramlibacter monticola TaxID=1926872 RepID=UPI001F480E9E|nr:patatin-like phospholipase family protein [Ramlibacter monticola]
MKAQRRPVSLPPRLHSRPPRIALALAGGGPLGAIWEIGALCALEEALGGIELTRLDHYVGVSAGGFIAAGLANGIAPRALCAAFIENRGAADDVFDPRWLTKPAWGAFLRGAARLPLLAAASAWRAGVRREALLHALEPLTAALPEGVFSSEPIHDRLARVFSREGRSNDFRRLASRLTLVATDVERGEAVAFGSPGWDHVPVSRAVQATCALPGLFPPVEIDGRRFVDGALTKTLHASVALEDGMDLVLCLNPLVPFALPGAAARGLPSLLGQTIRTMIHSRLALGMRHYARAYPGTDIVLLEPEAKDAVLQRAHPFGYAQRRALAEHAYQRTRAWLRGNAPRVEPTLARHGIVVRSGVLRDDGRLLIPGTPSTRLGPALDRLRSVLDDLDSTLQCARP